jgi:hypothetical protein
LKNLPSRTLRTDSGVAATGGVAPVLGQMATAPTTSQTSQPAQQRPLTIEEQAVLMAIEREKHKNDPHYPPMPPIPGIDD